MPLRVSVLIPARNEAETVGHVVAALQMDPNVDEIIVIDNGSTDDTAQIARNAGAKVIRESRAGKGAAVKAGLRSVRNQWVITIDADLRAASSAWVQALLKGLAPNVGLVKGNWFERGYDLPLTNFLVRPSIQKMFPFLSHVEMPISGMYLFNSSELAVEDLSDDFSIDLNILMDIALSGKDVAQVDIGEIQNRDRGIQHDRDMSFEIINFLINRYTVRHDDTLLVLMAHSDDPVIWTGGTICKYLQMRARVKIVTLFGTTQRDQELRSIATTFPDVDVESFGFDEFVAINTQRSRQRLADILDTVLPRFILTHHSHDQHSDHRATHDMLTATLMERDPASQLKRVLMCTSYHQELSRPASFLADTYIDITRQADLKYELISRHKSQTPEEWINMTRLLDKLNGARSGVAAAEPFETLNYCGRPLAQPAFS